MPLLLLVLVSGVVVVVEIQRNVLILVLSVQSTVADQ